MRTRFVSIAARAAGQRLSAVLLMAVTCISGILFAADRPALAAVASEAAAAVADADAQNPTRCLDSIGRAIDAADSAAFARLVDVDGLVEQALSLFLQELARPENAAQLPPMLALLLSGAGSEGAAGEGVRALLRNEARAFVLNGVSSGAFAGRQPRGGGQGLLAPLFADASLGRKELRADGPARRQNGDWLLPFVLHDHGNGQDYPVLGRFSATASGLRLTGIDNLPELMERIRREAQALE